MTTTHNPTKNFEHLTPQQEAAYGAIFGALAADAAGATLEFLRRNPTQTEVDEALQMVGGGVLRTGLLHLGRNFLYLKCTQS